MKLSSGCPLYSMLPVTCRVRGRITLPSGAAATTLNVCCVLQPGTWRGPQHTTNCDLGWPVTSMPSHPAPALPTLSPLLILSRPERACRKTDFPEPGGPISRVKLPCRCATSE